MKKVVLPASVQLENRTLTPADTIRGVIFCREAWRLPGNVKMHLALEDKLDALGSDRELVVTDMEHELLVREGMLPGVTLGPPEVCRMHSRVMSALYDATKLEVS